MSESDSFVEEVSEEIRRDRLFGFFKRYGWIIGGALVLIIGGAIANEVIKARTQAQRQADGDALMAAITSEDVAVRQEALVSLSGSDKPSSVLAALGHAAALVEDDKTDEAIAAFQAIADQSELAPVYRDLALLKALMLDPDGPDADQTIAHLAEPGRPYWPLAVEMRALGLIRAGDVDGALADLTRILEAPETTPDLRQRAQQMMIVLGGEVPQQPVLLPDGSDG